MSDGLRCPSRIFGLFTEDGKLEAKCNSKHCGAGNGVVVLHYFDLKTGELTETKKFRDPASRVSQRKD